MYLWIAETLPANSLLPTGLDEHGERWNVWRQLTVWNDSDSEGYKVII